MKKSVLILLAALLCLEAFPQRAKKKVPGYPMYFYVEENGDTTFVDSLDPAWCLPHAHALAHSYAYPQPHAGAHAPGAAALDHGGPVLLRSDHRPGV